MALEQLKNETDNKIKIKKLRQLKLNNDLTREKLRNCEN